MTKLDKLILEVNRSILNNNSRIKEIEIEVWQLVKPLKEKYQFNIILKLIHKQKGILNSIDIAKITVDLYQSFNNCYFDVGIGDEYYA